MVTVVPPQSKPLGGLPKGKVLGLNGASAVAQAMRQTNPDVVAAYPITPSTIIVEVFSQMVADGEVSTEFVAVESEHSAMSACIGAAAAGARTQTVTTSQGLALMWEELYVASGMRLPIVLHGANRALSGPLNIHCDHTDTMGARDSGWLQLYAESPQEAYDNALMSVRIAEHPSVLLPVLHSQDGYTVTHCMEPVHLLPDEAAKEFVGPYQPQVALLDMQHPVTLGAQASPDHFFEIKRGQVAAIERALSIVKAVSEEFSRLSGRPYGLIEGYKLDDAKLVMVALGSTAGTAKVVIDGLRERGVKAGLMKIRCFRPFPSEEVAAALQGKETVAVMDRAVAPGGAGNPLFSDICTTLFTHNVQVKAVNYVFGLGGRDAGMQDLKTVYEGLLAIVKSGSRGPAVRYLGLRE